MILLVPSVVAHKQLHTHAGRLVWFGRGWAAHTSADIRKGSNIPNSPGFEEEGKKVAFPGTYIPHFPGIGKEGKKGGEKPKAGTKNPKAASTEYSSGDGGLVQGVHLVVGGMAPTGGLVHGVHLVPGAIGVHPGVGAPAPTPNPGPR